MRGFPLYACIGDDEDIAASPGSGDDGAPPGCITYGILGCWGGGWDCWCGVAKPPTGGEGIAVWAPTPGCPPPCKDD